MSDIPVRCGDNSLCKRKRWLPLTVNNLMNGVSGNICSCSKCADSEAIGLDIF